MSSFYKFHTSSVPNTVAGAKPEYNMPDLRDVKPLKPKARRSIAQQVNDRRKFNKKITLTKAPWEDE